MRATAAEGRERGQLPLRLWRGGNGSGRNRTRRDADVCIVIACVPDQDRPGV